MYLSLSYWQPNYDLTQSTSKDHAKFSPYFHMDATTWLQKNLINEDSSSTKRAMWNQIQLLSGRDRLWESLLLQYRDHTKSKNAVWIHPQLKFWTNIKDFSKQIKYCTQPKNVGLFCWVFFLTHFFIRATCWACNTRIGWWKCHLHQCGGMVGECR